MNEPTKLALPLTVLSVLCLTKIGVAEVDPGSATMEPERWRVLGYPAIWVREMEPGLLSVSLVAVTLNFLVHFIFWYYLGVKIARFYERVNPMAVLFAGAAVLICAYTYSWISLNVEIGYWLGLQDGEVLKDYRFILYGSLE